MALVQMTLDPYVKTSSKIGRLRPKLVSAQNQKQNQSYLQYQYDIDRLMTQAWELKRILHRIPFLEELKDRFTDSQLSVIWPYLVWAFPSLLGEISR